MLRGSWQASPITISDFSQLKEEFADEVIEIDTKGLKNFVFRRGMAVSSRKRCVDSCSIKGFTLSSQHTVEKIRETWKCDEIKYTNMVMCNTVESLNKGHLGTQAAVPYSEAVPYWEVCIKLCFYSIIWCIDVMK